MSHEYAQIGQSVFVDYGFVMCVCVCLLKKALTY